MDRDGKHMKAFAGEMLTVIVAMRLFCKIVLGPVEAFIDHARCLELLANMMEIFQSGDQAAAKIPELRNLVHMHHVLFARLYENCMKPKIHYLKHCVDCIQKYGKNMNCFAAERKHKDYFHSPPHSKTMGTRHPRIACFSFFQTKSILFVGFHLHGAVAVVLFV